MPKRVLDFDAMWGSDKLAACAPWAQAEYAWLYGLADASGCFEVTNFGRDLGARCGHPRKLYDRAARTSVCGIPGQGVAVCLGARREALCALDRERCS